MENAKKQKKRPHTRKPGKLNLSLFDPVAFLCENNINPELISKMKFSESGDNRIKIQVNGFQDIYLIKRKNGIQFDPHLPGSWLKNNNPRINVDVLLASHPLFRMIQSVSCFSTEKESWIEIVPKDEIPYILKTRVVIPKSIDSHDVYEWFSNYKLIKGPSKKIRDEAYNRIYNTFLSLKGRLEKLDLPNILVSKSNLNILVKDLKTKSQNIDMKKTGYFTLIWSIFQITYDFYSKTFTDVKEPCSDLLSKFEESQNTIPELNELLNLFSNTKNISSYDVNYSSSSEDVIISISVMYRTFKKKYKLSLPFFHGDIEWIEDDHYDALYEDTENVYKICKKIKESSCYGSVLAQSIIEIVMNGSQYNQQKKNGIREEFLIKILHDGNKNTDEDAETFGIFKILSDELIKNMIQTLKECSVIRVRSKRERLYITDKKIAEYVYLDTLSYKESCVDFTDMEWLDEINSPTWNWEWKDMLTLLDHPAVYCKYPEPYVRYFKNAPKEIIDYLQIMSRIGSDTESTICGHILLYIKKHRGDILNSTTENSEIFTRSISSNNRFEENMSCSSEINSIEE